MTGNTELGYWRKNKNWHRYNAEKKIIEMTDEAPERAKKSFEMAMKRCRKRQGDRSNSDD